MKWNLFYSQPFNVRVAAIFVKAIQFFFFFAVIFSISCAGFQTKQKTQAKTTTAVSSTSTKSGSKSKEQKNIVYSLFCEENIVYPQQNNLCEEIFSATNRKRKIPLQKADASSYNFRLQVIKNSLGYTVRLYRNKQLIQTGASRSYQEVIPLSEMMINDFVPDFSNKQEQSTWETF